ncbi:MULTISPECIES: hypothetical protein [Pseudonocardia]|uniref:hypothetical protein n=1 Tax=Pseudonocardia TaxID=1847 RepID=UPI000F769129|nr:MULTISPECIES: hypothetical protein [Pseudonocardia]
MFDPISPDRLVAMLGDLLRESARWEHPLDEFRTSQLLSASSVARYLAAELAGSEPNRTWFVEEATALVDGARGPAVGPDWAAALDRAHHGLTARDRPVGEVTTEVLRAARAHPEPAAQEFTGALRGLLAQLTDRHVALLTSGAPR